jgi:zinc protease
MLLRRLLLASSALALLTAPLAPALAQAPRRTAAPAAAAEPWPHAVSDLKPDPTARFGTLANGMKYAIMPNRTPPGEASIRMRFNAGSLNETDAQRGVAHFLEHMAFNGSRSVPEGEMVKILERAGLAFGPDTNASTGFTQTIYMLDLPETDPKTLETGLFLMRETAGELLLDAKAIDRERGIILSEERARDTPGLRIYEQRLDFFLKGQLPAERLPIGSTEVIRTAPRAEFADFYARHYRPDQATLVVVGDVDPAKVEADIRAKFGDWQPGAAAPRTPNLGTIAPRKPGEAKLVVERGGGLSLQLGWLLPPDLAPDTQAERVADMPEAIGFAVMNRRFERLARGANAPFIAAGADRETEYDAADVTSITVNAEPDRWREALAAAEQEQRRVVQHGVLQAEVDREVAEYRAALTARVAGAATRRSSQLAMQIVQSVDDEEVFTSPAEDLRVFEAAVKGLTAARVGEALRYAFSGQGPLVFMSSPKPIEGGEATLAQAFTASTRLAVAPPAAEVVKPWPYKSWGQPGRVAEQRRVEDLDTTFVRFANGVRLTVKPTKLEDDEVLVSVRVGGGRLDLPRDREVADWAAPFALAAGGTTELTDEEIDQILAGKVVGASFSLDDEAFVWSGRTRPEDFGTQLELLTARTVKPGFRPEPFARVRAAAATQQDQLEATPSGVLQRDLGALLRSGDPRWTSPTREQIASAKLEELKALVAGPLANGPVEVVIVGDISLERAIAETARTFGALPPRPDAAPPSPAATTVRFPAGAPQPVARSHRGRADQAIGYAAWPAADFLSDPQRARAVRVLEQVMSLRLNDELREAQGATYSPFTSFDASLVYPGFGFVAAGVEMPPEKLAGFYADVRKIAASLREAPPSADELARAKQPRIEALQRARASNEYWLGQLSGAQADPRRLDLIREAVPGMQKITAADVHRVAQTYLSDEKLWRLSVTPAR